MFFEMEELILEQIFETKYSEGVINAVRYGYQYRIEAEKYADKDCQLNHCLVEPSAVLLWLASLVKTGVVYDLIKIKARHLWDKMMQMKVEIPEDVNRALLDEDELGRFVKYVDEFDRKELSTTDKETIYIRNEIIADYVGAESGAIFDLYHRMPTSDEFRIIIHNANERADKMLNGLSSHQTPNT